jgi:hypothetical protein
MSVPLHRINRVVIFHEWFTVKLGTFEVVELSFDDEGGNPTHPPLGLPAYHFFNDNNDEYFGPLSQIQLIKLTPG